MALVSMAFADYIQLVLLTMRKRRDSVKVVSVMAVLGVVLLGAYSARDVTRIGPSLCATNWNRRECNDAVVGWGKSERRCGARASVRCRHAIDLRIARGCGRASRRTRGRVPGKRRWQRDRRARTWKDPRVVLFRQLLIPPDPTRRSGAGSLASVLAQPWRIHPVRRWRSHCVRRQGLWLEESRAVSLEHDDGISHG